MSLAPFAGVPTLGNYFGALQNWVRMQDETKTSLYMVVDLHALTIPQNPDTLRVGIRDMAMTLLAIGLDPQKSIIFQQSKVRQHAELGWILSCICPYGMLGKMTQWKDKGVKQNKQVGLFTYPVLQAADILIYSATHVPVGADQRQHLELTRDLAGIFNHKYDTDILRLPEAIFNSSERVMSFREPTKKMSKSDPHDYSRINLNDSDDLIMKKLRKAVTDSEDGIEYDQANRLPLANLIDLAVAATGKTREQVCSECSGMNKLQFKEYLAHQLIAIVAPIREEYARLESDRGYVDAVLNEGSSRASAIAEQNMVRIKEVIGIN
ncbi:tryptophanyl-tRNA synthetase [Sphaeroforma arctica JP610]|uniref:tryptophan--tRNA ligase n=1 Tax=Sphaeroforma arctica JP610 TaxID=667725 RepID=A0A0L0FXA3_9EUKA|nr:tryptophanyl-tRNA synthetase [Sphaeroforma arctica JP610]KNC80563.1 tryptophanyl-tRNA synthetase [Sphaeroforma arctica JP610]|eukprot:XP_014154465.1 tryptophanyl-tRNA synthetase [Sphaeroforma arctica JP610]